MVDLIGKKLINEARCVILDESNLNWEEDVRVAMSRVYRYFKRVLPTFKGNIKAISQIVELEKLMDDKYLPIDSAPDLSIDFTFPKKVLTKEDALDAVKAIVFNERIKYAYERDIMKDPLHKECLISSTSVRDFCEKHNIRCKRYRCNNDLSDGMFHSFCIVSFPLANGDLREYIIDCTYRQFFTYGTSFLERNGVVGLPGCCLGRFMLMNESRKKTATDLLRNGYLELTAENIKNYFDGFVFQGRNGEYYSKLGKEFLDISDYDVEYSYLDYIDAIDVVIKLPEHCDDILTERIPNPSMVFDYELFSCSDQLSNIIEKIKSKFAVEKR